MILGLLLLALACLIALAHNDAEAHVPCGRRWNLLVHLERSAWSGLGARVRWGEIDYAARYGVWASVELVLWGFYARLSRPMEPRRQA